jgi:hypothetical protein
MNTSGVYPVNPVILSSAFGSWPWGGNSPDPSEGTGAYPIGVFVRVRAKFELNAK